MPASVKERNAARRTSGQHSLREFWIDGVTSDDAARTAMLAHTDCPASITVNGQTLNRDDAACEVEELFTISADGTTISGGKWLGTGRWQSPEGGGFQPAGSFTLSFDISGQSHRVTHSRRTVNSYAAPGKVKPNFKQAINVQQDGTVEGTDIQVPYLTYTITKTYPNATITQGWILVVSTIVGAVNSEIYRGFAAGELLLFRVSGQQRPDTNWDITFNFAVSLNQFELRVGDIQDINKNGWDFLWVYYEDTHDTDTKRVHKIPVAAYVEEVYRQTDYSPLGI